MKLSKKISAVVLAALMVVVAIFAGCSSSKSTDDSKTNTESTTSAAKVKVVDIELSSEKYAFGVDKKQPELKEKCNELIKEMKSNGELEEIPKEIVPDSLSDINGVSEKTGESGSFYFIYRSNRLASEIVIKNKWLSPVETTKKPENKEPFAEMTETRSNTVPHK